MHSPRIIPDQIIDDFVIENIGIEKFRFMEINEFVLKCAVESLAVGVHLGSFGISVIMS